ncbi:MAG: hypothetical protein ACJASV_001480, partial [Pseudorhodobacter sp.]
MKALNTVPFARKRGDALDNFGVGGAVHQGV